MIITIVYIIFKFFSFCDSLKLIRYYTQKENYISVTGTVSYIHGGSTGMCIVFSELSPILDDTRFNIVGKNLEIVQSNKISDKLKIGERITFITAPGYFWDAYVMPIVAISIHGEYLLDFEEGYENLLDWLYDKYDIPECIVFWGQKQN